MLCCAAKEFGISESRNRIHLLFWLKWQSYSDVFSVLPMSFLFLKLKQEGAKDVLMPPVQKPLRRCIHSDHQFWVSNKNRWAPIANRQNNKMINNNIEIDTVDFRSIQSHPWFFHMKRRTTKTKKNDALSNPINFDVISQSISCMFLFVSHFVKQMQTFVLCYYVCQVILSKFCNPNNARPATYLLDFDWIGEFRERKRICKFRSRSIRWIESVAWQFNHPSASIVAIRAQCTFFACIYCMLVSALRTLNTKMASRNQNKFCYLFCDCVTLMIERICMMDGESVRFSMQNAAPSTSYTRQFISHHKYNHSACFVCFIVADWKIQCTCMWFFFTYSNLASTSVIHTKRTDCTVIWW